MTYSMDDFVRPNTFAKNLLLKCEGFFISFNTAENETALSFNGKYLILEEDHTQGYLDAVNANGFEGCVNYFLNHSDNFSYNSNSLSECLESCPEMFEKFSSGTCANIARGLRTL